MVAMVVARFAGLHRSCISPDRVTMTPVGKDETLEVCKAGEQCWGTGWMESGDSALASVDMRSNLRTAAVLLAGRGTLTLGTAVQEYLQLGGDYYYGQDARQPLAKH